MARPLRRYLPHQVFEVSSRTVRGEHAFVPCPEIELEWAGVLAEANHRWPAVKLHMAVVLTNACRFLLSSHDANAVARWTSFVFAATARLAKRWCGIEGIVWERRYRASPILDADSVRARVKALMRLACDADLVDAPRRWPGLNSVDALCRGVTLRGCYVNARARRKALRETGKLPLNRTLEFAPLPTLPADEEKRKTWFRKIEQEVIAETKARQRAARVRCPRPEELRRPEAHVGRAVQSAPVERCYSSCEVAQTKHFEAWRAFVKAWRAALAEMKRGIAICFPAGGWWPFDCHVCVRGRQDE